MNYLIHGQNQVDIEERVARLRDSLDPVGLSTSILDAHIVTTQDAAAACHAVPFFGGERVVVIRSGINAGQRGPAGGSNDPDSDETAPAGKRVEWQALCSVVSASPATTILIWRNDGLLAEGHSVHKLARAEGWKIETHRTPRGRELLHWIDVRAASMGASIDPGTIEHLLDQLYPTAWRDANPRQRSDATVDMRLLVSEIEKLAVAADGETISRGLVDDLVEDRSGYTPFRLNDLLFGGQPEQALLELERVLSAGEAAERVLAQIASEASALATARDTRREALDVVASATRIPEWRLRRLRERAAGLPPTAIGGVVERARAADKAVKTSHATDMVSQLVPLVAESAEDARRK